MQDPKSQVDMFEDDRLEAILGNMSMLEDAPEEEKVPEPEEKEE